MALDGGCVGDLVGLLVALSVRSLVGLLVGWFLVGLHGFNVFTHQ